MTAITPTVKLTERFIEGLKNYNVTYDEIIKGNWKYCGGRSGCHLNYFKVSCKNDDLPKQQDKCICGHAISENCYITNDEFILVLGSCCIKKFLPKTKSSRTCEKCGDPHKNRKVNRCNKCRSGGSSRTSSEFIKPIKISDELASFLEKEMGFEMARTDITHDINAYIRTHNLQDPDNGRKINPDTKLASLLKLGPEDELNYFNLQRFLKIHYVNKN
uniref:DM2 domain-containing protein n=1 Tax=viral metagenome TaxID=1070528 RepID=A0A6C0BA18_9ZZZZ